MSGTTALASGADASRADANLSPHPHALTLALPSRWSDFQQTDNSCRAAESKLEELEAYLQLVETKVKPLATA